MKSLTTFSAIILFTFPALSQKTVQLKPALSQASRIEVLLNRMTLDEKLGQLSKKAGAVPFLMLIWLIM